MTNGAGKFVNNSNTSSFDFNVKNASVVTGHLNYNDPSSALRVDSINVTVLTVGPSNTAVFSGNATVNGTGVHPFTVTVVDNSKNGKRPTPDTFMIEIPDMSYTKSGNLTAGNIHVNP